MPAGVGPGVPPNGPMRWITSSLCVSTTNSVPLVTGPMYIRFPVGLMIELWPVPTPTGMFFNSLPVAPSRTFMLLVALVHQPSGT